MRIWYMLLLVHAGIYAGETGEKGWTMWHYAAAGGHMQAYNLVLTTTIPPINTPDAVGWLPIHIAAANGQIHMCDLFLKHGANVNVTNNHTNLTIKDFTPLHVAVWEGHLAMCKFLLAKGACVDAKTAMGETALHIAAKNNFWDICTLLLEWKADRSLLTAEGLTALTLAQQLKQSDSIKVLTPPTTPTEKIAPLTTPADYAVVTNSTAPSTSAAAVAALVTAVTVQHETLHDPDAF